MISNSTLSEHAFASQIADKYKTEGFEVIREPAQTALPFDLGGYRPDLLVKKSDAEGYVIEVKTRIDAASIDRFREIAEIVAQHPGWRFLLVTGEDASSEQEKNDLLTWEQMSQGLERAERLLSSGEPEGAFLSLWRILEAALRRQAVETSIPVERLPTSSLIKHIYSQGEISIEQFDTVMELQSIRNRLVHGHQTPPLDGATKRLQYLVIELIGLWKQSHAVQQSSVLTQ
ncbi:MAG: hypothetical protein ACTFAL_14895 [Candidatus Electronema sp. V4]|uniref:hypothetical protein n=1 Tax=Candidatus Electronema sp. V4 TaxID=3454756 RepID=UPI004055367F